MTASAQWVSFQSSAGQWTAQSRHLTTRCSTQNHNSNRWQEGKTEALRNLNTGLKITAILELVGSFGAAPVYAIDREWKPRRHHRRLGEGNTSRPILESSTRYKVQKQKRTTLNRKLGASMKKPRIKPKVKQILLQAENPEKYFRPSMSKYNGMDGVSAVGSKIQPAAALLALIYVVYFVCSKVMALLKGGRQRRSLRNSSLSHGKWIRDRSLGGKEVFVASETVDWNPLGEDNTLTEAYKKASPKATPLPSWWTSRPYIHIREARKAEGRKAAQNIIRALDEQRFSGTDYSFDLMLELYLTCKDTCISAKTSSVNVATSLFRFAVRHSVMLTAEGIGLPYGLQSIEFLCHLSEILKLHPDSAISIMHGETASKLRAALLQTFVDVRTRKQSGYGSRSVIRLLSHLPLPRSDAELIGSSITSTTTEQERIQVYALLCEAGPEFAEMIGALLGKLEVQSMDD